MQAYVYGSHAVDDFIPIREINCRHYFSSFGRKIKLVDNLGVRAELNENERRGKKTGRGRINKGRKRGLVSRSGVD
jgi:hypothetical protein